MADIRQRINPSVKLSSICLGGRSIRFLTLRDKAFIKAPKSLSESHGIPLFLASDVLCGCSQLSKNFTRIHARYSKDGMATKLLLKDFRVLGVSHSTTVWFYNIRGVFQVVFEYQEKKVQRDCLSKLKDIWLCRYHDDNLPENLGVTLDFSSPESGPTPIAQENHNPHHFVLNNDKPDEGQELFPLNEEEIVIELIQQSQTDSKSSDSRHENTMSNNSTDYFNNLNGISLLDNDVNGTHTSNKGEEIVPTVVKQALLAADNVQPRQSSQMIDDNTKDLGEQDLKIEDVHLCHSCGSLNCSSFQSTQTDDGETSCGLCTASRLEKNFVHKPLCCNKATQIDTVPRSVTKVSVGVQTDQCISLIHDCPEINSKESIQRNASLQTEITMDTMAVLTPNCLHASADRIKCHNFSQTSSNNKHHAKQSAKTVVINECISVLKTLIKYLAQMQSVLQNLELSPVLKRFHTILQLLIRDICLEEHLGFPFQLIQEYLDMLVTEGNTDTVDDEWGNSSQRNLFLHIVCHWLGQEFHKFEPLISQRVEDFKQKHINCIDNLPPAERIVDLVFPSFMKELIVNWTSRTSSSPFGCMGSDHDYSPPVKRLCVSDDSSPAYPLVQHILEFANHALVSGVAHVVYSRLRHSV
ncbi:uncharacterized protein LOC132547612 [Ylistrum balloti]|uniref:uncharacterized protein LOC132547612 n=1 Tax=Ylistrum balloti TaxID=509963 RepID=UPI002905E4AC|nr:uncharacterized protein LOC132547612 [Ylistrum balloti]